MSCEAGCRYDRDEAIQNHAYVVEKLVSAGFTLASVKKFIKTGDINKLEHSGLFSVQLYKPNGLR